MYPTCWQYPIHFQLHLPLYPSRTSSDIRWKVLRVMPAWLRKACGKHHPRPMTLRLQMDQMAMISLGLSVQMEHWRDESNMETRNERTSRKIPGQVMDESDFPWLTVFPSIFKTFFVFRLFRPIFKTFSRAFADDSPRQAAKLRDPFRRRFTAAWCFAETLHHAVTNSPAVGQFLRTVAMANLTNLAIAPYLDMIRHNWSW